MARSLISPIDARWLARAGATPGCATGQLPVDFDRMLAGTDYDADMGQSSAAFAAGRQFERNAAGPQGSYAPLLKALAEAGLDVGTGGVDAYTTGTDQQRAERTRKRIRKMLDGDLSVVLIAQAVLAFAFAGFTALIRPDAVVIVPFNGQLIVVELKGFRKRSGHYPGKKIATALEQTAVYQIALRRIVAALGFDPALVSDRAVIVCATGRGLQPEATIHDNGDRVRTLEARIARAEQRLTSMPDPGPLLAGLTTNSDAGTRLAAFQTLVATYGTAYHPACLQKCGAAFYCREAAYDSPTRLGATRLLGRAGSIRTAVDWAGGSVPTDPQSAPVAQRLSQVAQLTAVARADAGLTTGPVPGSRRRGRVS